MALLRKIEHCVNGVQPAWEETFMNWNSMSKNLSSYPKAKIEDGQMEPFHRSMGKRRASHQNSEHELEEQINEWANMTGFLCALGGVCLQRKSPSRPTLSASSHSSLSSCSGIGSMASSLVESRKCSVLTGTNQEQRQYCPVTQYEFFVSYFFVYILFFTDLLIHSYVCWYVTMKNLDLKCKSM